ncbi:MAG: LytTR family DNA-binding domain-containing protein [Reichenbachiella sp.]
MKCMIVEDELPAVKVLENYISKFSDLELVSVHHNAMDAIAELQKREYDILFLDIQLPGITGIQMLSALSHYPNVVLTTAHREYAIEGYELQVSDYLLKPISFDRFTKSIAKIYQSKKRELPRPVKENNQESEIYSDPFIYIKSEREHVKVLLKELLYIESLKNHIKLFTKDGCLISMMSLLHIEERLPNNHFLRIHRSYIIAIHHIDKFNQISVAIGGKNLPIGRHYKQNFLDWAENNIV